LIWHIDYDQTAWNKDVLNDVASHQRIDVVEAGNLKVTGYYDGFDFTHLVDDVFPGSQNVNSFTAMNSWAGVNLGVNLYNILEEDEKVCFATQDGISVETCVVESSSSSVELSSSSETDVSSSSVELLTESFTYAVKLQKDSLYTSVSVDVNEALESLGVAGSASSLFASGDLLYYAVESDGSLNPNSTASAPGNWFDASGNVCNWDSEGSVARVFSELDLSEGIAKIGQYPLKTEVGKSYTIRQALVYGQKRVDLEFKITIVSDSSDAQSENSSVIALLNQQNAVSSFQVHGNLLQANTSLVGKKDLTVYDLSGKILYRDSFYGFSKTLELENLSVKGVFLVRLSQNGRILSLKRMAVH
jgi:hypothetical protein